ncbi:MAG: lasso peptide biosynthesis B2 protein [Acidobacteriota bacterium]
MKRWHLRLRAFCRLASEDRAGLFVAWFLLLSLPAVCRLAGVRACLQWMRWIARFRQPQGMPAGSPAAWVERQSTLVSCAAQYCPKPPTCLIRALTLWFLLAQRGVVCDLRLGVGKKAHVLEAHAWVEWCGQPVMESSDVGQRYAVFDIPLNAL